LVAAALCIHVNQQHGLAQFQKSKCKVRGKNTFATPPFAATNGDNM